MGRHGRVRASGRGKGCARGDEMTREKCMCGGTKRAGDGKRWTGRVRAWWRRPRPSKEAGRAQGMMLCEDGRAAAALLGFEVPTDVGLLVFLGFGVRAGRRPWLLPDAFLSLLYLSVAILLFRLFRPKRPSGRPCGLRECGPRATCPSTGARRGQRRLLDAGARGRACLRSAGARARPARARGLGARRSTC
jgi:hypothetical protein